jgi:multiple antibiotic resistance protein
VSNKTITQEFYNGTENNARMYFMISYSLWDSFILTFVPLFVVVDAVGTLPFVISMSEEMSSQERKVMVRNAVLTAAIVGFLFLFLGQLILRLMQISVGSFAIGGGIVLLVLSVNAMVTKKAEKVVKDKMVGIVPIGTPLTAGPATVTTLLLLVTQFPVYWVVISFAVNIIIVWLVFATSSFFMRILGRGGTLAISKVSNLLLAAIAVNMCIRGLSILGIINVPV